MVLVNTKAIYQFVRASTTLFFCFSLRDFFLWKKSVMVIITVQRAMYIDIPIHCWALTGSLTWNPTAEFQIS